MVEKIGSRTSTMVVKLSTWIVVSERLAYRPARLYMRYNVTKDDIG